MLTVAIIQKAPIFNHLVQSLELARQSIEAAAQKGAQLIVFGETWLCGYPAWLDHYESISIWGNPATKRLFAEMFANGITVPGPATEQLAQWARKYKVFLGMGCNEVIREGKGNGSIFNSFLLFSDQGKILIHHRKLVPTFTEKLLYTHGDANGLHSADSPWGKISGLVCWEHWMPQTRQALHDSGELIHIALWPTVNDIHQLASRHYAIEGRCFVVAVGQILRAAQMPSYLEAPKTIQEHPDQLLLKGGSCIFAPDGSPLLAPVFERDDILYCKIEDLERAQQEKLTLNTSGHYNRPDIFSLEIDKKRGF